MKPLHTKLIVGGVILFWVVVIAGIAGVVLYRAADDCRQVCELACMGADERFFDPEAIAECLKSCDLGDGGECREACLEMAASQREHDELQAGLMNDCGCDCAQ